VKKLRQDYKRIAYQQKGSGNNRKQFKHFDQLHSFLANRPVVRPPHIVSSSNLEDNTNEAVRTTQHSSSLEDNTNGAVRTTQHSSSLEDNTNGAVRTTQHSSSLEDNTTGAVRTTQHSSSLEDNTNGAVQKYN